MKIFVLTVDALITKKDSATTDEKNFATTSRNYKKSKIPIFKKKAFWVSIVSVFVIAIGSVLGIKMYQDKQIEKVLFKLAIN